MTEKNQKRPTRNRTVFEDPGSVLLLDKPKGWTSFDVVKIVRQLLRVKRAGHAGTLDPMATGLLIVCTGKKTKEVGTYVANEKEYEAELLLGASTATYDGEAAVESVGSVEGITNSLIENVLNEFVGKQRQVPPMHSAVKVGGKRLYKYARKGKVIRRDPRTIEIRSITPVNIRIPRVQLRIVCSKGTYVRSLAHDIGKRLGCGAFLKELRRTRIGKYEVSHTMSIDDVASLAKNHRASAL